MKTKIKIREAQASDCKDLANLMGQLGYPTTQEDMLEQIKLYQNNQAYKTRVAKSDNNVIGCVSMAIVEYFHKKMRFMRITSLIVEEQHRRQGIGKLLMAQAESFAREKNCNFIELSSGTHREKMGSHDFYKALGYQDIYETKKYMAKKLVPEKNDLDPRSSLG